MDKKNLLLLICTVLSFFTVFAVNAVTIVIPSIAAEFHMSNIVQNWVTIIFLLVVAVLSVPAGQISAKCHITGTVSGLQINFRNFTVFH